MGLTADEIATRAFTPSADGYHQGEVRAFLERVAAQLRGLQAALPEGGAELAALAAALHDHEPRMTDLHNQLNTMLDQLGAATLQLSQAQTGTPTERAATQVAAANHVVAGAAAETDHSALASIASEQRAVLAQLTTELAVAQKLTAEQREASEHLAMAGEQSVIQAAAAEALVVRQTAVSRQPSGSDSTEPPTTEVPPSASIKAETAPTQTTAVPAVAAPTLVDETLLFGSALDDRPLFSDNAHDLLDGVVDDVMGTITDEGNPT